MATNSTQAACNHRALEVANIFLSSTVVGLLAGVVLAMLGMPRLAAVGAGGGALVGSFSLGMVAISYIRQDG